MSCKIAPVLADNTKVWMFKAGPESCRGLPARLAGTFLRTAPATGAKGDLFFLYATKPCSQFVGIGRICSDPVRSRHRRLHGKRAQCSSWVQVLAFEREVPLATARSDSRAGKWSALRNLAGTHAEVRPDPVLTGLTRLLLSRNPIARKQWSKWDDGEARYPRELGPQELAREYWEPPKPEELPDDHEKRLQKKIERMLLRHGWRHHTPTLDDFSLPLSKHLKLPHGTTGYPDIVLVSVDRRRTLLVVEVKKYAVPRPWLNGIDQLEDYCAALKGLAPTWNIKSWLVARSVHPAVLEATPGKPGSSASSGANGPRIGWSQRNFR